MKFAVYGAWLLVVLASPNLVIGCGPFFDEAIFSFTTRPDPPLQNFLSGKLGVVEPTYRYRFLFAAYRQLAGVPLDANEQAAIVALDAFVNPQWSPTRSSTGTVPPLTLWTQARAKVVRGEEPKIDPTVTRDYANWTNCQDDAFRNAARTLDDRVGKFGGGNPDVREWVSGQDTVFANCGQQADAMPRALDASAPMWLRADRNYQIAAAKFYAGQYDDAAQAFRKIAADRSSPWAGMAPYLAARCLIRKGLQKVSDREGEKPDTQALTEAEAMLTTIVADPAQKAMRGSAESLLGFVEFRLHPDKRAKELATSLMKPHGGEHFRQELMDYTLLLDATEPDDDLSDWIRTLSREGQQRRNQQFAQPTKARPTTSHALEKWRETKSLPWLVAALMLESPDPPAATELRAAAERVPTTSPAYVTAQYHAVRLLGEPGQLPEARRRLETLLGAEMPPSAANLFQQRRARLAATFAAFLKEAQIKPVGTIGEGNGGGETTDVPTEAGGVYFDVYGAEVLNKRTALTRLEEAVKTGALTPELRRKVALAAWTRAVLLGGAAHADALSSIVSEAEPSLAGDMKRYREASADAKQFEAVWILLRHPGMRPYVTPGLDSRPDKPEERDPFRDNWWCGDVGAHAAAEKHLQEPDCPTSATGDCPETDPDPEFPFPAWASEADRAASRAEWERLRKVGTAPKYLGDLTLAWVRAHADDPRAPEALAQVVTATHYGCATKETTAVSKAAFALLHERYPRSEWAKRTKYWY
jgi:hypothetical protein